MQDNAAHDLLVEGPHPEGTPGDLPHDGEGLGQQIVEGLPPASLSRNSSVFFRSSGSESFSISGSNAETVSTRFWRTLSLRPSPILNIFVNKFAKTNYLVLVVVPD